MKFKCKIIVILIVILNIFFVYGKNRFLPQDVYLVSGENVNVREKPDIKSKVITQLTIADRVKLIKKSDIQYKNRNIVGNWVYVDTYRYIDNKIKETIKGWVLDYYLVGDEKFQIVNEFYDLKIEGYYGDSYINFEFHKDGSYKQKYFDRSLGEQERESKYYYGHLYWFKNIYITKLHFGVGIFYVLNNRICAAYTDICTEIK